MAAASMRVRSALSFGCAMAASVIYFFIASPYLLLPALIATGVGAAVGAAFFGWLLGAWYVPAAGESPGFELVAVPLLVPLLALVLSLLGLSGFGLMFGPPEPRPFMAAGTVLGFGFSVFLSASWPALLAAFAAAGIWLARSSRVAPNCSLKRTNQSLRD